MLIHLTVPDPSGISNAFNAISEFVVPQANEIHSKQLYGRVEAFEKNIHRLADMLFLPAFTTMSADMRRKAFDLATFDIFHTLYGDIQAMQKDPRVDEKYLKHLKLLMFAKSTDDQSMQHDAEEGFKFLAGMCTGNPSVRGAITSTFANYIVGMWTAFEVLAGDLWEESLNIHPAGLSELKEKGKPYTIPASVFQKQGFDFRSTMGTVLRSTNAVTFTVLSNIQDAYKLAFFENNVSICESLNDPHLAALSAARNVIVHRDCVCDEDYIQKATRVANLIPLATLGNRLSFDGSTLAVLASGLSVCTMKLIKSIDAWIIGHPMGTV